VPEQTVKSYFPREKKLPGLTSRGVGHDRLGDSSIPPYQEIISALVDDDHC
jgi:hypothetical protein